MAGCQTGHYYGHCHFSPPPLLQLPPQLQGDQVVAHLRIRELLVQYILLLFRDVSDDVFCACSCCWRLFHKMTKRSLQQIGKCADAFRAIGPSSVRRSFFTIAANLHLVCLQLSQDPKWKWPSSYKRLQAILVRRERSRAVWTNQFLTLVLFLKKAVEREKNSYLKRHEIEWLYSMLLSALPFLNLAIFSRDEAERTGLLTQKTI